MKNINNLLFCITVLILSQNVFGQKDTSSQSPYELTEQQKRDLSSTKGGIGKNDLGMIKQPEDTFRTVLSKEEIERRKEIARELREYSLVTIEEINKGLTPPQKYLQQYSHYKQGLKGGIFRLFPEKNCGKGKVADVKELERCGYLPQVAGFGSRISFKMQALPEGYGGSLNFLLENPDIYFADGNMIFGNSQMLNFGAEIDNIDFDKIDLDSAPVKFLKDWKRSKTQKDLKNNQQILEKGINDNGYFYSSKVSANLDSSYVFRSIAYHHSKYRGNFWNTDSIIAFKIVGQEPDGSIVLIWKKLREKNADSIRR